MTRMPKSRLPVMNEQSVLSPDSEGKTTIAWATLPPPVMGLAVATERFIESTRKSLDWTVFSVGRRSNSRLLGQLQRLSVNLVCAVRCLFVRHASKVSAYMPLNAGVTIIYSMIYVLVCRVRGISLLIHHHSYAYINRRSLSLRILNCMLSARDGQIFLSPDMAERYCGLYRPPTSIVVLPGSYTLDGSGPQTGPIVGSGLTTRVGHLSNLTMEKGLRTVIACFARLLAQSPDSELHLAGPVTGKAERALLDEALEEYGKSIIYWGPVYEQEKDRFFRTIDRFWMPSEYVNEAQPIVLIEAMSYGVPCIAMKRGCIDWLLGDAGKVAISKEAFFEVAIADALQIENDAAEDQKLRQECLARFQEIREVEKAGMAEAIRFLSLQNDS